jgi:hypothetical protein
MREFIEEAGPSSIISSLIAALQPLMIGTHCWVADGVLFVIRSGQPPSDSPRVASPPCASGPKLGVVLNGLTADNPTIVPVIVWQALHQQGPAPDRKFWLRPARRRWPRLDPRSYEIALQSREQAQARAGHHASLRSGHKRDHGTLGQKSLQGCRVAPKNQPTCRDEAGSCDPVVTRT